jgi:hypothetical protein
VGWRSGNFSDSYSGGLDSNLDRNILTDVFNCFLQSLHVNDGVVHRLGDNRLLPNPFQFICHPTIPQYNLATDSDFK